jgi:hypothetical protein
VSIDVTFEEEVAFMRSRGSHMDIDNEKQEEMVPSPPPVDVPRRYCSRSEETYMDSSDSAGGRKTCSSSWYLLRE